MLHRNHSITDQFAGAIPHHRLQRLIRDQRIDNGAIQRSGYLAQCGQLNRALRFRLLHSDP